MKFSVIVYKRNVPLICNVHAVFKGYEKFTVESLMTKDCLLLKANSPNNSEFSNKKCARFTESIEEPQCMSEFRFENRSFHCVLMHFDYRVPSTAIRQPLPTKPSNGTFGNLGRTYSMTHFILFHGIFYGENHGKTSHCLSMPRTLLLMKHTLAVLAGLL